MSSTSTPRLPSLCEESRAVMHSHNPLPLHGAASKETIGAGNGQVFADLCVGAIADSAPARDKQRHDRFPVGLHGSRRDAAPAVLVPIPCLPVSMSCPFTAKAATSLTVAKAATRGQQRRSTIATGDLQVLSAMTAAAADTPEDADDNAVCTRVVPVAVRPSIVTGTMPSSLPPASTLPISKRWPPMLPTRPPPSHWHRM